VTERKRTEAEREQLRLELDRERMRLQEIMDSIPGAVYETVGMPGTPEYKLAYISPYVEKMLGSKVEEIDEDPLFWVHYCPKEYREEALEQVRSLPPNTDKGSFSFKWQHKAGRIFDVEAHFSTRRDEQGNVAGRTGVVMDVSERLQAQQELTERRDQLARLMSNVPGMAYRCLTDKGWPFEYVSSGCTEFTGYPAEDFLISGERRWFELINSQDLPEIDRIVEDCISRNAPIEVTYRIRHASGEERFVLDRAVFVKDDNGEIVAFEGICIDITEIKRAQDAIMQANQAKDQFIAALSHELRTPLTPVLTCVEILKDDERMPKDLQPMMEIIERNIQLESRLIDDLLDLTRIIRGKVHLEKKTMDLHSLLLNAVDICSSRIREKKLDLQLELKAKQSMIHCDPARMQQVLWNLLQNAAKFTPQDGTITVRTWNSAQDELFISIQDSGIGMEAAQIKRIFNPFEQGTPTITKRYGGLGLGLAISQRIVDLHAGSINAFSEGEGQGATFTITLPISITENIPNGSKVAQ
jgi:PAS domain S-box-containing protein